jgi:hypothetical protein
MRGVGFQQCRVPCHFSLRSGETTFEHDPGDGGLNASATLYPLDRTRHLSATLLTTAPGSCTEAPSTRILGGCGVAFSDEFNDDS